MEKVYDLLNLPHSVLCKKISIENAQCIATTLDLNDPEIMERIESIASKLAKSRPPAHIRIRNSMFRACMKKKNLNSFGKEQCEQMANELLLERYEEEILALTDEVILLSSLAIMLDTRLRAFMDGINPFANSAAKPTKSDMH